MIRSLAGTVTHLMRDGVVVDVSGVGYLVNVPLRELPHVGQVVRYCTYHHIRADAQALFGFTDPAALAAFQQLLKVPSIGPKSALAILSVVAPADLARAVEQGDAAFFASIPGIGTKSAAKIIVELKGQVGDFAGLGNATSELIEALKGLGYREADIAPLLRDLPADTPDLQAKLTWVLRRLASR